MASFRKTVKKFIPTNLFSTIEPTGHLIEAVLTNIWFGFPSRKLHVIGITGTNGKTTTSFLVQKMLVEAGYKTGLMTTVAYGVNEKITPQIAHMTTASAPQLQRRLKEFKKASVEWVVLETTSHSLAQHRVWGIPYEIAVLTNITHEHLDYHKTFERYIRAKRRLFEIASRHGRKLGIVNADDPNASRFSSAIDRSVSYGIKGGDLQATNIDLRSDGVHFTVKSAADTYEIDCHIPGEFNVYNSLAAVAVGREIGLSVTEIERGIESLAGVEGRMTVVDEGQPFSVIVDFAHTPDSFERLLGDLRRATKGKLVVLFGSAGRRDESKRAIQGEIAGRLADEVILTEEDDRDVDGNQILAEIAAGSTSAGKKADVNLFSILNREEAIAFALTRVSSAADTVILLGKGHEKTIERSDGTYPWNEIEVTKTALQALASEKASQASK